MASPETPSAEAPEMLSGEARLQRALASADTLGDVSARINDELQQLDAEVAEGIETVAGQTPAQIRAILETRQDVIAPLAGEYGSVQVATLDAGVLGMAPVGGSVSQIHVSADAVASAPTEDLKGVLVHEGRHTDQVQLETGEGAALIIGDKKVTDEVVLLEGDTESTVIRETGFDRSDRPAAVYEEGLNLYKDVQAEGHADLWNTVLTSTGRVEDMQNALWADAIADQSLTTEEIAAQAEETGYALTEEAANAQNEQWREQAQQGSVTIEEIEEAATTLGIEIDSEVHATIAKQAAETRDLYLNGPRGSKASTLATAA